MWIVPHFVFCVFTRIVVCLLEDQTANILGFQRSLYPTHASVDETVISDVRFQAFRVAEVDKAKCHVSWLNITTQPITNRHA